MSLLRKLTRGRSSARRTLLVNANAGAADAMLERVPRGIAERLRATDHDCRLLASSVEMEPAESGAGDVSLFAPLTGIAPDDVVVGRELRLLLDNDFTVAWLAWLAVHLPPAGSLYLELPPVLPAQAHHPRLRPERLARHADILEIDAVEGDWNALRVTTDFRAAVAARGFAAACAPRVRSALPALIDAWPEFSRRYQAAHAGYADPERLKPEFAARQFVYTLHGTSQKSHLLEWLARHDDDARGLRVLDMGGGYGAMAVELAVHGHTLTVVEIERAKIEQIGTWLAGIAGVEDRVRFVAGDFDSVDELSGEFDIVSFFGSLLYYPHDRCTDLLRRCRARMAAGGTLVVHENPRDRASPEALDYANQFLAHELDGYVQTAFGNARYVNIFDYRACDVARAAESLIVLAAQNEDA